MAVNWLWKDKVGEIQYKDMKSNQKWKLEMFTGNMMCCFIRRYKLEGDKRNHFHYTFFTFFNDIEHAKRCLNDEFRLENMALGEHKVIKVKICVSNKKLEYSSKEMLKLAKILVRMGYKVELY